MALTEFTLASTCSKIASAPAFVDTSPCTLRSALVHASSSAGSPGHPETDIVRSLLDDIFPSSNNDDLRAVHCECFRDGCHERPARPVARHRDAYIFRSQSLLPLPAQSDLSAMSNKWIKRRRRTVPSTVNRFPNLNRSRLDMMPLIRVVVALSVGKSGVSAPRKCPVCTAPAAQRLTGSLSSIRVEASGR